MRWSAAAGTSARFAHCAPSIASDTAAGRIRAGDAIAEGTRKVLSPMGDRSRDAATQLGDRHCATTGRSHRTDEHARAARSGSRLKIWRRRVNPPRDPSSFSVARPNGSATAPRHSRLSARRVVSRSCSGGGCWPADANGDPTILSVSPFVGRLVGEQVLIGQLLLDITVHLVEIFGFERKECTATGLLRQPSEAVPGLTIGLAGQRAASAKSDCIDSDARSNRRVEHFIEGQRAGSVLSVR